MKKLILFFVVFSMAFALIAGEVPTDVQAYPRAFAKFYDWLGDNLSAQNAGTTYYVDSSLSSAGDGKAWSTAYLTIAEALAQAGDNAIIWIAQGDYVLTDTLEITQDNLRMFGVGGNQNSNAVLIYNGTSVAAHDLLHVKANNVEIAGIGFTTINDSCNAITISPLASKYKTWIHHCRFDGYGAGVYAIHTGTTYDSPDVLIENNVFRSFVTASVYANATRGIYRNNIVHVDAAGIGFEHVPTTGSRPDQLYHQNLILGTNSTDVGIKITNSPSAGTYMIVENKVLNCSTSITGKATNDAACVLNYVGDASGGALIDPSP